MGEEAELQVTAPEPGISAGSFDDFFRDRFAKVARTMMLVTGDFDAGEELAQEAFARTFARWDRFATLEHATNSVFAVAWNLARSRRRRDSRAKRAAGRAAAEMPPTDETARVNERMVILAALRELSRRQRACVALVDYAGMSDREVAEILGMRPPTVRVHLARGRARLREALRPGGDE
ncbi:MAG TPA: sigma-70 family RNA polymerase sigma factor [Actinomycetota bacterium]